MPVAMEKRPVRILVSYADANWDPVQQVMKRLTPELKISRSIEPHLWASRRDLVPGTDWDPEIDRRIGACDLTLWMLSSDFFASDYIRDHEIVPFLGPHRRAPGLPVSLYPVDLYDKSVDLHGIEGVQVFRLNGKNRSANAPPRSSAVPSAPS